MTTHIEPMNASERIVSMRAWYFDDTVDLKKFRAEHPHYPVLKQDPLILELDKDHYAVLSKFGTVVFWNYSEASAQNLRDEITRFIGESAFDDRLEDDVPVIIGAAADQILPNSVRLAHTDIERISLVARAIGQSVALERLELKLDDVLGRIVALIDTLRNTGRVKARTTRIFKTVGFAMSAKHAILRNLTLLDKPDETWESPELDVLYRALYNDTFDLTDRVRAMDRKLDFLQDAVTILLDHIQQRRSLSLEIAIVVMIFIEIVIFLPGAFK